MGDDTIAITGMGVVSSIGTSIEAFTENIRKSRSGLTSLSRFDPSPFQSARSFEISDFKLQGKNARALMRMNKNAQYTIAAAQTALRQSGYPLEANPYEVGLILGSSFLDVALVTKYMTDVLKSQLKDYRPLQFPNTVPNATAAHTAIELNIKGPNITLISMQNGAISAVEYAIRMLRAGQAKMVLVGGIDVFARESFLYFQQLERIAGVRGPEIHIPFSEERNGFILGEGCGMLALEKTETARRRGASIVAEIRSVASTYFPCPATEPLVTGLPNTELLYDKLLKTANLEKERIGAFFSCASSCIDIDAWEDQAIVSYFGKGLPVSAFSSFIGEAFDGSLLHLVAAIICLQNGFLFPVLGYSGNSQMESNILQKTEICDKLNSIIVSRLGMGGSYKVVLLTRPVSG
jgi:3-oxoacyl-[acyl-carrier-protein] synthase II